MKRLSELIALAIQESANESINQYWDIDISARHWKINIRFYPEYGAPTQLFEAHINFITGTRDACDFIEKRLTTKTVQS